MAAARTSLPPSVSVLIPTKNAGPAFRDTLASIASQRRPPDEIVIVDSGSSDGTLELARAFGACLRRIDPDSFNHGEARNLAVRESQGQLCLLLVQDAIPANDSWLEEMIQPLLEDQRVAGVSGGQAPLPGAGPFGRWEVAYHRRIMGSVPRIYSPPDWERALRCPLEQRLRVAGFNNVSSSIRRSAWDTVPFQRLNFAEDLDWGIRTLEAGYKLAYNPNAVVRHSHDRSAVYSLKRQYVSVKTVPRLARIPPTDLRLQRDGEFRLLASQLIQEVQQLLAQPLSDWQQVWDFGCDYSVHRPLRQQIVSALLRGADQPSLNSDALREPFYGHLSQVAPFCGDWSPARAEKVIVGCLARAIGTVAATYYRICQARDSLSEPMSLLDAELSHGV